MDFDLDVGMPRRPRRRFLFWLIPVVLVLFILTPVVAGFATDWLWYRELQRADVYWTLFWGRWVLGLAVSIGFFAIVFGNLFVALRETSESVWVNWGRALREHALYLLDRTLRRLAFWAGAAVTLLFAWVMGRAAADYWPQFLLFSHTQTVGQRDPIFHRDIGFYLFQLPVWQLLLNWLFAALIFALVLTGLTYLVTRAIRTVRGVPVFSPAVQAHLSILVALLFVAKAADYYLQRFSVLYADTGNFVGAGYADVHARVPGLWILFGVAVLAAGLMLVNTVKRNIAIPAVAVGGLVATSIIVLGIYPAAVQRFRVEPNQLTLETPYLANHIKLTRQAYGLDKVRTVKFSPTPRVEGAHVAASPQTINNVRLWDYRPLQQVYRQRQELRTYYDIRNVDVDRYRIDGQIRQVMVAARELGVSHIPGDQAWDNRHLIYTHGYGVVMSPVNEFDPDKGEPVSFISDIPPVSTHPSLQIVRPEIYFGENDADYILVRTRRKEFDYPKSGDENEQTTYAGRAGIPLRNPLTRALLALRYQDLNLLISNYITPESRMIIRRQITERAQALAPFLLFDRDPYIVVGADGHLYWMLDAYTHSRLYPYSRHSALAVAGDRSVDVNYLRNPVKVVVDAYDGTTRFYLSDAQEPMIRAWQQIFPRMFRPITEMPAGLRDHVRVPEGLFNALSDIYQRYHMTDPMSFYGNEDVWDIPQDASAGGATDQATAAGAMEAYYIVMSMPGQSQPEYLLIRPYLPKGRPNMIAWLSARNDAGHLGEMLVYNFPKQSSVYGPQQIEARINQAPEISEAFTLWGQSGSRVWKGNLLVIPLGDTILYVQPIYLQAEQSQIPELQRVIVADQQRVVMRRSLPEALAALTGGTVPATPSTAPPTSTTAITLPPANVPPALRARAKSALEHYDRAQQALQRGDWTAYGKEMKAVRDDLEALNRQ